MLRTTGLFLGFLALLAYPLFSYADLVLHLPFDEGAGQVAADASDLANEAQFNGAVNWVEGKFGQAIELAAGGYVDIPEVPAYDVTTSVSLVTWIATDNVTTWARVIDKSQWQDTGFDLALSQVTHAPLFEYFVNGTTSQALAVTPVDDGNWHMLVGTLANKTLRIYVDGVMEQEVGATNDFDINPNDWPIRLGREANAAMGQQYVGKIDDVAIFNHELSAAEIAQIQAGGVASASAAVQAQGKLTTLWSTLKEY